MLRNLKSLIGFNVVGTDGQIGTANDFLFDDTTWRVRYLVLHSGNWLLRRKTLISPLAILRKDWESHTIHLNLSRVDADNSPDLDSDLPVARHHEAEYFKHFRWPYYWTGAGIFGTAVSSRPHSVYDDEPGPFVEPLPANADEQAVSGDFHLRSALDIMGYQLRAGNEHLGHIDDLVIDEKTWTVRYAVVSTGSRIADKKALISTNWITEVNWLDRKLVVALKGEQIKGAPELGAERSIDRALEQRIFSHYGKPGYWEGDQQPFSKTA